MIVIGIDPGVETGIAVADTQPPHLLDVDSGSILQAMKLVRMWYEQPAGGLVLSLVIVEDARRRKWFGNRADLKTAMHGAGVREGVGSVKRDCSIWEEFLTDLGVPFEMRYPHGTKMKAEQFKQLTGWTRKTNQNSRDAALIVYGINESIARAKLVAWSDGHTAGKGRADRPGGARAPA